MVGTDDGLDTVSLEGFHADGGEGGGDPSPLVIPTVVPIGICRQTLHEMVHGVVFPQSFGG